MTTEREGFLARWARRKRETAAPPPSEEVEGAGRAEGDAAGAASTGARSAAPGASPPTPADEPLPELPLPSLEDVKPGGDLSVFFAAHVPETLRNAALQRMWRLDPLIRDFENPAREYAYNWNAPGGVPNYGPLPEGFDAEAMFRRITGREEAKEPAPTSEEAPAPAAAGEPVEEDAPAEIAAAEPEGPDTLGEVDPTLAPEPDPVPVARAPHDSSSAPVAATSPPSPKPRPRRHGGALPA